MAELRVESDGTSKGTRVTIDGKPLRRIQGVAWEVNSDSGVARLTLDILAPDLITRARVSLGSKTDPILFELASED